MDSRKASLSTLKLCRFCLSQNEDMLTSIYGRNRPPKNMVTLPLKILSCLSIEVCPSDKMPVYICQRCKFFMEIMYDFKYICRQADENILQFIQNGTPLTPMNWSAPLVKLFRMANKSEVSIMKTVIEGGATVQVTAHESESDDEDDENVYNVKIGDGSDEGSKSTRVKVITTPDKPDKSKSKKGKDREESVNTTESKKLHKVEIMEQSQTETKIQPQVKTDDKLKKGVWSCDKCERSYPLQQMLELHKKLKHRELTISCNQCDATFFTLSDMAQHKEIHDKELKYQCEICSQRFKREIVLERHQKLMHQDLSDQACDHCSATFLTVEQLKLHKQKHAFTRQRRFRCKICKKRFLDTSGLLRHIDNVHDTKPEFICEYCPSRFTTAAKLTKHLRANHAEERSYPCKYCNKSFLKSHHYTRHLRLKHRENIRTCRGPFGETDLYRCEQCEDSFATQDQLIYHSAIHARKNLVCPLCAETFDDVETATAHIKSHANGSQHMCDFCELMFTTQEKLENHLTAAHEDEIRGQDVQDESSMEMEAEEEDDDADINIKEEDDHMLVEIKKPDEFMLQQADVEEEKMDNTNSEESESDTTYTDLANLETIINQEKEAEKPPPSPAKVIPRSLPGVTITKTASTPPKIDKAETQTASILRKAEEIKKKVVQQPPEPVPEKKPTKSENSNTVGASDKSLRLLEKDLQELKRTTTRSEAIKTPAKVVEPQRTRRAPIFTSTPKLRAPSGIEDKKSQVAVKSPAVEKKIPERRVLTKENKEPKEIKDTKANNVSAKEDKKEDKEVKEVKEKETPKSAVKNGSNENKSNSDDGVRRSTRPSKIKDYAKMIRDSPQESDDNDSDDSDDDEEYKESEKVVTRPKSQRGAAKPVTKPTPPAAPAATPATRKRGRPRKDVLATKIRKEEVADEEEESAEAPEVEKDNKAKSDPEPKPAETEKDKEEKTTTQTTENEKPETEQKPASGVLVSPSGQTLKKIPIKALPPGVKPLPLPVNARTVAGGEVCEMQIGKKVVKVQKIVMTKAEVEAMAKKGLVEMKDGTMVLKQGIKLPTADPTTLKTSLVSGEDATKESPSKKDKAAPSRCDFNDDA